MSDDGAQAAAQFLGRTVGRGRFGLRSVLGVGGMASVYLAHDSVLDRDVAVKTLHSDLGREQSFRERFRREAQAVAKLTHTNIVSVFDSGEDEIDGAMVPYIVMEYVEGKPLRKVLDEDIAQHGAMPTGKALKIAGDVLAALEVSHEMGLVHRDIKPGNVMVNKRGVVKVMDFGIARAMQSGVTSMTQTGMVVGTPQYLSPEQALGRGVDARSDIYSVGILLFELLTGRLPFDAESALAIAYAHVQEDPPLLSSINRSVTQPVDELVARTLRKNPDDRFPSAEAMQAECARIGGAGAASGASPIIISGGPAANSGAGLGQAVFPPVNEGRTPPPGAPQQPFPPQQFGGFGPSTPPPGPVPMGAPTGPGGPGYPMGAPFGQQPTGIQTPAPWVAPTASKKSNVPLLVGISVVAALLLVMVLGVLAGSNSGGGTVARSSSGGSTTSEDPATSEDTGEDSGEETTTSSGSDVAPEDKAKTIDPAKCTDATKSYNDRSKVLVPDFTTKNLASVKSCISAAGWELGDVAYEDENVWGKNAVLDQTPGEIDDFDPENDEIELTVSTGQSSD